MTVDKASPKARVRLKFSLTGVVFILFFFCLSLLLSLIPIPYLSGAIITLSVSAKTDSLQMQLKDNRMYSLRLPPGKAALFSGNGKGCIAPEDGIGLECTATENVTLQITGGPNMSFEVMPKGRFVLTLEPQEGKDMEVKLLGQKGEELAATAELMFFETVENASDTRLPLIIENAIIGALLYESAGDMGQNDSTWQPMLLEGDYAAFANVSDNRDRFLLLKGSFDSGDVITLRAKAPHQSQGGDSTIVEYLAGVLGMRENGSLDAQDESAAIWGHLLIESTEEDKKEAPPKMTVVMNTSFPELEVKRFGAPQGHRISVPPWLIVSELPFWQSSWVIFISLLLVYDAYCAASDRHRGLNKALRVKYAVLRSTIRKKLKNIR